MLKLGYIFVRFPVWSETFAVNDVVEMNKHVDKLKIYNLRSNASPIDEFKYSGFDSIKDKIVEANFVKYVIGKFIALTHPILLIKWLYWLFKNEIRNPVNFLKCYLLGPQVFYIWNEIKKENLDIVHLFWGHFTSSVGFLIKESQLPTKISLFLGAYDLELGLNISVDMANKSDFVFTHAGYNISQMEKLGIKKEKIQVIHRGVNLDLFKDKDFTKKKGKFITVGRLTKPKAFDDALKVFAKLYKSNANIELTILGTGPEEDYLKVLAKELQIQSSVIFKGRVNHNDVLQELEDAEIFLFPSKYQGDRLPNVVKEAMASGCVSVVTDTAGINELVDNGVSGFIYPMGDNEKATTLCQNILEGKVEGDKISKAAQKKVRNDFSVNASAEKYLEIWK